MKKHLFRLLAVVMAATMSASLASCSDDDDNKVGTREDLIGTWDASHVKSDSKIDGQPYVFSLPVPSGSSYMIFNSDGTCVANGYDIETQTYQEVYGTWTLKGNILSITSTTEGTTETETATLSKLTSSELVMNTSAKKDANNYLNITMTFRKQ